MGLKNINFSIDPKKQFSWKFWELRNFSSQTGHNLNSFSCRRPTKHSRPPSIDKYIDKNIIEEEVNEVMNWQCNDPTVKLIPNFPPASRRRQADQWPPNPLPDLHEAKSEVLGKTLFTLKTWRSAETQETQEQGHEAGGADGDGGGGEARGVPHGSVVLTSQGYS